MTPIGRLTPHPVSVETRQQAIHPDHPAMSPLVKLAVDVGSVFTPFSRPIAAYTELRALYPALRRNIQHAMQGQHHLVQHSFTTSAGVARTFAQIASPKSAKAADVWSTGETMLGGELGNSVRNLISLVPLPMPAKVGVFAASYGVDALQAGYARDPEKVTRQMFATGSDFGDHLPWA